MLTNKHVLQTVKVGLLNRLLSYSGVKYSEFSTPLILEMAPFEKENSSLANRIFQPRVLIIVLHQNIKISILYSQNFL